MLERIEAIRSEASAAIGAAAGTAELEELRVRYLGRKSELTTILRGIADLPAEERGPVGSGANKARQELEGLLESRAAALDATELEQRLGEDRVDVTLPGAPARPVGHTHLITRTTRQIEDTMIGLGYRVIEGPEIEHDYYNFTALNHPPGHPARMLQDTFYVQSHPDVLLRTHTSPVQIRAMEEQPPPIFIVAPGKVYRRDSDATHSPMFHQVEGLAIGEGITLADLQGTLEVMLRAIFGEGREARMRPHFFPFTEPSVEFDVSCFQCEGTGSLGDGARCNLCKGQGWIEVGGAGMVDPNVLGFVESAGYDSEKVQGFAFGMGVERIAMLRHGVPDLRRFFDNDVRLLEQFS
jgi:phenylalanyl-tRNA synthetase alpha chain